MCIRDSYTTQCTKPGEKATHTGRSTRWRGSRSRNAMGKAWLHCRRNFAFVQVGEHLSGHPQYSFESSHPPCGSQQSNLSAAGSVGECLSQNDNDSRLAAYASGHSGGTPGRHDRMYRHASVCHSMGRHGMCTLALTCRAQEIF